MGKRRHLYRNAVVGGADTSGGGSAVRDMGWWEARMSDANSDRFFVEKLFSFAEEQGRLSARQDSAEKAIDRLGDEIVKAQNQSALHVSGEIMRLEQRIEGKLETDREQKLRALNAMQNASREETRTLMRAIIAVGIAVVAGVGALDHIETIVQLLEIFRQ